jgi:SAM-dependent methyltransferase
MHAHRGPSLQRRIYDRIVEMAALRLLSPRDANLVQCHEPGMWEAYFDDVESVFEQQWQTMIWPLIKDFDFSTVLELSPGAGRNTQKLATLAKRIVAVDYNQYALDRTRARLGDSQAGCVLEYHRNGGTDLAMVPSASVTTVYCWDSAVHFDRDVLAGYIAEFARVLKPGGRGFLHHSDLGDRADANIKRNPHWRSNVNKELVADECRQNGLVVLQQQPIPWDPIVDRATIFEREIGRGERPVATGSVAPV